MGTRTPKQMTKPELLASHNKITERNRELEEAFLAKQDGDAMIVEKNVLGMETERNLTIVERLIGIGREVGPVQKGDVQNFQAFLVDDIYSKLRPLFNKWGVVLIPTMRRTEYTVTDRGNKSPATDAHVWIDYSFYSPDGSHVTMTFAAEGRDFGDKATSKAVQMALKYGLIQMFMISTGEVDPDEESGEIEGQHIATHETTSMDTANPVQVPNKVEVLMKQVKDHAWLLNKDVAPETYRVEETKLLVESEVEAYGREPKDAADAQAIMKNMDLTMENSPLGEVTAQGEV